MPLSQNQRDNIKRIATMPGVMLYREQSMSGQSETLRYRRSWVERSAWGSRLRSESHMILSVKINVLPDGRDDPQSVQRYRELCAEAEALFASERAQIAA